MGEPVNLVRPDGSLLQTNAEDAAQLKAMGYQEEDPNQRALRDELEAKKDYYTTGAQGLKTFAEGVASGASFGISDYLEKGLGWDNSERAEYNPGKRFAGEITGMIGGSLIGASPAGLVTHGAEALTEGIGNAALRGGARGALEGAAFGVGSEVSHTALSGDPLTVESAIAGAGWGALWGGGIGFVTGGVVGKMEARRAAQIADAANEAKGVEGLIDAPTYNNLRGALHDAGSEINNTIKTVGETIDQIKGIADETHEAASKATAAAKVIRDTHFNDMEMTGMENYGTIMDHKQAGINAFKEMQGALKSKDWGALEGAQNKFSQSLKDIDAQATIHNGNARAAGMPEMPMSPEFQPFQAPNPNVQLSTKTAEASMKELSRLGASAKALQSLPTDAAGFAGMTQGKADRVIAAVDSLLGSKAAELEGLRQSVTDSISKTAQSMGVEIEGGVSTQLRKIYETVNEASTKVGEKALKDAAKGFNPWKMAGMIGRGAMLPVNAVLLMKSAVVKTISAATEKWVPGAMKGLNKVGPKLEPLKTRLDGTEDKDSKDKKEMMKMRAQEIRDAAPGLKDTLFKAVAPLNMEHPEFAQAMYQTAQNQFSFLLNKLPTDPGNAYSRLQSLYNVDPVAMEKWSRYYEVFQNPLKVMQDAVANLRITPEAAEAMQNMYPAAYTQLRVSMLSKLSNPDVMNKVSYDEQVRIGTLLNLPLHSTMTPQFIASQMQMYTERNQKLSMPPQPGAGESAGRPSSAPGSSPFATPSQNNQLH